MVSPDCSSASLPQLSTPKVNVGGAGTSSKPAAIAARLSWYTGLASFTAVAKFDTGPRSMTTTERPVGLPMWLLSTLMGGA
jgi:hypothetical protein